MRNIIVIMHFSILFLPSQLDLSSLFSVSESRVLFRSWTGSSLNGDYLTPFNYDLFLLFLSALEISAKRNEIRSQLLYYLQSRRMRNPDWIYPFKWQFGIIPLFLSFCNLKQLILFRKVKKKMLCFLLCVSVAAKYTWTYIR